MRLNYKRPTSQILFQLLKRCIIKHHHAISYPGIFYISIRTQLKIARSEFRKIGEHCETELLCSVYWFLQDSIFLKSTYESGFPTAIQGANVSQSVLQEFNNTQNILASIIIISYHY